MISDQEKAQLTELALQHQTHDHDPNQGWVLDEAGNPKHTHFLNAAPLMENNPETRKIARTEISPEVYVSTVFLSINHNFGGGLPLLFETMIFGGPLDRCQWRYNVRAQAERGHRRAVELAQLAETDPEAARVQASA